MRRASAIRRRRIVLWHAQGGRCDCCDRHMWERQLEGNAEFRLRVFGAHTGGPSKRALQLFWLCTYEHVHPISIAGSGRREDWARDVATCSECNQHRDRHDYARFRALVRLGNKPADVARLMRSETP